MNLTKTWQHYKTHPDAFAGFISIGCLVIFIATIIFAVAVFIIPLL